MIVLAWLRKEPMDLKTFVQNRVVKVQELYLNQLWRHVPSDQNPADLVSRGVDPDKLLQQNLWFVENLKGINKVAGPLTTKEFEKAETFLVKKVQEQEFSSDINHLKSKGVCYQTLSKCLEGPIKDDRVSQEIAPHTVTPCEIAVCRSTINAGSDRWPVRLQTRAVVISTETESGFITEDDTSPVCHTKLPEVGKIQSTLPMMWVSGKRLSGRRPQANFGQSSPYGFS
ncbi:integrase catalytic domain-containing protein [Trichonephila clavipes]|nr:integrase catalytic domain-containing protein [Trichonephila clavipes]